MTSDRHEVFQHMIDEALAAGSSAPGGTISPRAPPVLRCNARSISNASRRVIASLGGFSFEVDPAPSGEGLRVDQSASPAGSEPRRSTAADWP